MRDIRAAVLAGAAAVVFGCQSAPEPIPVAPIPDGQAAALPDLLNRARLQAAGATEAFYLDNWNGLEDAASALAATAGRLPTADGVPADKLAKLEEGAAQLGKEAGLLRKAAKDRDADATTQIMSRVNRAVRDLSAGR